MKHELVKKILRNIVVSILILAGILVLTSYVLSEKLPAHGDEKGADVLAHKMLSALHENDWKETRFIGWTFFGTDYVWDKKSNVAAISWDDRTVYMKLDSVDGVVLHGGQRIDSEDGRADIKKAWKSWCNDSFWLMAPYKVFDNGTKRYIVTDENGGENLLVRYSSGGVTPGDSYLWILDKNYIPTGYKMWVSISPVKGFHAAWSDWKPLPSGALIATKRTIAGYDLDLRNIREGNSWADFGHGDIETVMDLAGY